MGEAALRLYEVNVMNSKELLETLTPDEITVLWAATWAMFGYRSPVGLLNERQIEQAPALLEKLDSWKSIDKRERCTV